MFRIKVFSDFSSAHNLRGYQGKCEELHGHNWKVELAVISEDLDDLGMVADFKQLKKTLNEVLGCLDHKYLNDVEHFSSVNPTSENIARFIHDEILKKRPEWQRCEVTVWETENSSATYSKRSLF
jgi:6-pyruvoyltetrahydropterin/6-carboxytetrahydropterin synthase